MELHELDRFQSDLTAALIARVPLQGDSNRPLTRTRLEQLCQQSRLELQEMATIRSDQSAGLDARQPLPPWFRAALQVFAISSSTVPVLDGLSARPLAIDNVRHALRWTLLGLMLLMALALAGLIAFEFLLHPALQGLHQDFLPQETGESGYAANGFPWLIAILAIMLFLVLISLPFGGLTKMGMRLGGEQYVRAATTSSILQNSQVLVGSGMSAREAVALNCEMVGAPSHTQQVVQSLLPGTDQGQTMDRIAIYFRQTSDYHLSRLRNVVPVNLYLLAGGLLVLLYGMALFSPVLSLLEDVTESGL